ncbi:MAG: methylated-DNA--[protein]-cysteine S-methyltransferase [Gammaproteobacteria bacterium]
MIQILWQSEVSGKQSRQTFKLLGEQFVLTWIGDVVVDSHWMLLADGRTDNHPEWTREFERALFVQDEKSFQIKLLAQGTPYNRMVWQALADIPYGGVKTYSELAYVLNSGPRAVAQACRKNPYPGIIPCHRAVSKAGLGGFMGQRSGEWVELKRRLLKYERNIRNENR